MFQTKALLIPNHPKNYAKSWLSIWLYSIWFKNK